MTTFVKCKICDKEFKMLNATHLSKHGMTTQEYLDRFPGAPMQCESIRQKRSEDKAAWNRKMWKDSAYSQNQSERLSKLLKETHKKNPELFSKKSSRVLTDLNNQRWSDPVYREKMTKVLIQANKKQWETQKDEQITALLKGLRKQYKKYIDRKDRNFHLRSSWELGFAILLDLLEIDWEYEIKRFSDHENRTYIPDFYLVNEDMFIEVKGRFVEAAKARVNEVERLHNVKVTVIAYNELKELGVFDLIPSVQEFKFEKVRFNDHPLAGSRAKRLEVQRELITL
jgi:hypothetical protein